MSVPVPFERPRRLRATPAMRRLVRETHVTPAQLVLPIFVHEEATEPQAIASLPGVYQHSVDSLRGAVREAASVGIGAVMLFAVPHERDPEGSQAFDDEGILQRSIRAATEAADGQLVVMSDVCLDEFTSHGHCGLLDEHGQVDNDATLEAYARMAVSHAHAGVDVVGLSGMMDGQVAAVRVELDRAGFTSVAILAYAAKFASAFYGPFRDAVDSQLTGDRLTYQLDPANGRAGLREAALDAAEGADIVMVKPALPYLDVLAEVATHSLVPVAAYHVSGEYAQIEAAAARGWLDRQAAHLEAITSITRAGADLVVTYAAVDIAGWLRESQ